MLICTSFALRLIAIVCVLNLLFCLANSSYRSYQRFDVQTRRKGQFCIVLTLSPRLCVALNKGIFDSGLNSNKSYFNLLKFFFNSNFKEPCKRCKSPQTDRLTDRQTQTQIDRQTQTQIDRQTQTQIDRHTD